MTAGIINGAVRTGAYPPEQGLAVKEAAELVRYEGRRVAAVMTGNFDYWGLPTDQRPKHFEVSASSAIRWLQRGSPERPNLRHQQCGAWFPCRMDVR